MSESRCSAVGRFRGRQVPRSAGSVICVGHVVVPTKAGAQATWVPAFTGITISASIAVLPFQNRSGDAEQEYFVDGMVAAVITALSRIRWLLVLARNSSFTYKGQAVDVKQVGTTLGLNAG
jgi:adenylate cyclase